MKTLKHILLAAICAAMVLSGNACGKPETAPKNEQNTSATDTSLIPALPSSDEPTHEQPRMENAPTLTMFRAQMFTKLNYERTLSPLGEIDLESVQDYTAAGIGSVPAAELDAWFQFTVPEQYAIEGMEVRRCPLYEHQSMELCEYDGTALKMEPGYYYEFTVYYEEGYARYGIVAETDEETAEKDNADIMVNYRYDGQAKQIMLHRSMLGGSYYYNNGKFGGMQTEPAAPYTYAEYINRLHTDHPQVTLTPKNENSLEPLPYVVWAVPLDEEYEPIWDGRTKDSICEDGVIALQEGLYYYNVTVTYDGISFDQCAFVANYSPTMADVEEDPLWSTPFLEDAPFLTLTRPIYGTDSGKASVMLETHTPPRTDRPGRPFGNSNNALYNIVAPVTFTLSFADGMVCESVTVRRYLPDDMTVSEIIDVADGQVTLEAGYHYEIEVMYENGLAVYGFDTEYGIATTPEGKNDYITMTYERNGKSKTTAATALGYKVTWAEQDGEIVFTHTPEMKPAPSDVYYIPKLYPTGPQASFSVRGSLGYAVAAYPLAEDGTLSTDEGATWIPLPITLNGTDSYSGKYVFDLLEGSYYYEICVNKDSHSYEVYVFIAHYTPAEAETGGNS